MGDMTLIERLESAEAGSRELDRAIWNAVEFDHDGEPSRCPAYTTSLDAALPLAERVLGPTEAIHIIWQACLDADAPADIARYACIALLRAKENSND